jgi:hypothetical protein
LIRIIGDPVKIVVVSRIGGHCKVELYRSGSGTFTSALWDGDLAPQVETQVPWYGDNGNGESVASGAYVMVFTDADGRRATCKVLVVR